jgi:hypothetical protein
VRNDVSFASGGLTCRGWFYAGNGKGARPLIVMSHGITAVKEQHLASFAERFANEGFAVLVFDYRYLGASEGEPRGRVIPHLQHEDLRTAITFGASLPNVDADRIALWGSSFSAGNAIFVGALDQRVKAVVAQVPALNIPHALINLISRPVFDTLLATLSQDGAARNAGAEDTWIPVVNRPGEPAFLAAPDAYAWFTSSAELAPAWQNRISLESIARAAEYYPDAFIELLAPRPLLMQVANNDTLIPVNLARQAFHRAGEPKTIEYYDCGHFDPYANEPWVSQFQNAQVRWLREHL